MNKPSIRTENTVASDAAARSSFLSIRQSSKVADKRASRCVVRKSRFMRASRGFQCTQHVLHRLLSHARADPRVPEKRPVIKGAGQHVEDQLYVKAPADLTP